MESILYRDKKPRPDALQPVAGQQHEEDVHLSRLLLEDVETPWYVSLRDNLKWMLSRQKEPPLQVTSKPVPVKDIWSEPGHKKISLPVSIALHVAVVGLLVMTGKVVKHTVIDKKPITGLVFPEVSPYIPQGPQKATVSGGGGGGGERAPTPASIGKAPKFSRIQLAPPQVVIRNPEPKLPVEPTVLGPPDLKLPQPNLAQLGDPKGVVGPPSGGPGSGGGIGSGAGGGVGSGQGGGVGPGSGGGFGGGVYRAGGGVSAPQLIYRVEPEYTEEARKAKYQGTVVLSAVVTPDGRVSNVRVIRSLGLGLDEKAMEAVKQWKFRPGMKAGQPVSVAASIEVTFRLL